MCGRFTLTVDPAELKDAFGDFIFPTQFSAPLRISPLSQPVLAIPNDGKTRRIFMGTHPSWVKDPGIAK